MVDSALKTRLAVACKPSFLALMAAFLLSGCAAQMSMPTASEPEALPPTADARQRIAAQLAAEPAQCNAYRSRFVQAFAAHVEGLSVDDEALQVAAQQQFDDAREALANAGVARAECRLPRCIIEPLQGGKLTYWCGFRLAGREGEAVNQWVEFDGDAI